MRRILFLIILGLLWLGIYAREVYCSIITEEAGIKIIPNKEYLTDAYWDFITRDPEGNEKVFTTVNDAINELANFGWYVVKTESNDSLKIVMGHKVDSYMEIKSSREKMENLLNR